MLDVRFVYLCSKVANSQLTHNKYAHSKKRTVLTHRQSGVLCCRARLRAAQSFLTFSFEISEESTARLCFFSLARRRLPIAYPLGTVCFVQIRRTCQLDTQIKI